MKLNNDTNSHNYITITMPAVATTTLLLTTMGTAHDNGEAPQRRQAIESADDDVFFFVCLGNCPKPKGRK